MVAKLLLLVTFIFGAVVALLWITVEAAGAVTDGSDWIWYLALGLTVVPAILFLIAMLRSRTRATIALTATAAVLLGGVLLTYPNGSVACTPTEATGGGAGTAVEGLDNGTLIEDVDVAVDDEAAGTCK